MKTTIIYKVYGCDTGGKPQLDAEFSSVRDACSYAVANKGKIDYGLPTVYQYLYFYDPETQKVETEVDKLSEDEIYCHINLQEVIV